MGYKANSTEAVELLIDRRKVSDTVQVVINNELLNIELVPYYNEWSLLINITSSSLFLFFGLFIIDEPIILEGDSEMHGSGQYWRDAKSWTNTADTSFKT